MHRTRLIGAPFTLAVVFTTLMFAMGCGGDDPVVVKEPPPEADPWAGVWAIISVGGANPSVTEHDEIAAQDPMDDVRFIASIAFTPSVKRYLIQMEWDVREADGIKEKPNTTISYDHTGRYERIDSWYTFTPDETQGTARLSAPARAAGGISANTEWFEQRAQRWVVHEVQTGTWLVEGRILTLSGAGEPTWQLKKR